MRRTYKWLAMGQRLVGAAAVLLVAAILLIPSLAPWLLRFEHWTADWRTAYLAKRAPEPSTRIALVVITDETLRDYASSPIDRGLLARIVDAVDAHEPAAIGIDIFFLKRTDPEKDRALLDALRRARAPVVLGAIDERGDLQPFQRDFQSWFLGEAGRPAGYLNLRHESDDVVRYTASPVQGGAYPESFVRLLAKTVGGRALDDAGKPIAWQLPPADGGSAFPTIAAHTLLAAPGVATAPGAAPIPGALRGRVVLIGGEFPLRDQHRIPLSARDGKTVAGVFIHASILAGLLDPARAMRVLTPVMADAVLAGVALLGFVIGWWLRRSPVIGLLGSGFATGLLVAADAACFTGYNLSLPFTLALVAWVAGLTAGRFLFPVRSARIV